MAKIEAAILSIRRNLEQLKYRSTNLELDLVNLFKNTVVDTKYLKSIKLEMKELNESIINIERALEDLE